MKQLNFINVVAEEVVAAIHKHGLLVVQKEIYLEKRVHEELKVHSDKKPK